MNETPRLKKTDILPWYIAANQGDGLQKYAILVALMEGDEMLSVSLHVAHKPELGA